MKNEKRKEKKVKNIIFALLVVICYLLVVIGCENPANEADIPAGKGSFSLAVSPGRTIQPNTPVLGDFAVYTLAFTPVSVGDGTAESVERTNANLATPILLDVGTYDLVVSAYKDAGKTQLLAQGTATGIVIDNAANISRSVTLEASTSTGTGTFKWDITLEAGITAVMKITPASGGTAEQTVTLPSSDTTRTLISGKYTITFTLSKAGETNVEWHELLYVYQNLESVYTHTFTGDYFVNTNHTVTYHYNDGGVTADQPQSVQHGATLTSSAPTRFGYDFDGWYTDNNTFNAVWNFSNPVVNTFGLYAKWNRRGYTYVITSNGTNYTATNGGSVTGTLAEVITAIRTDAAGSNADIQFGDGTNVLNIGTASAVFDNTNGTWGHITLAGKISSANTANTQSTIATAGTVSITSMADITNSPAGEFYRTIFHNSTGTLTISGGTVSTTSSSAYTYTVYNGGSGTIMINGGTVSTVTSGSSGHYAVYNGGSGTVMISGGTVLASNQSSYAVYNNGGTIMISGGTVENSANNGTAAVYSNGGTVTITGDACVTAPFTSSTTGTIVLSSATTSPSTGQLIITGGEILAGTNGYAVFYQGNNAQTTTLGGRSVINGKIRAIVGKLSVNDTFNPGEDIYTLDFASYSSGVIVAGGEGFIDNFALYNQPLWTLAVSGNDVIVKRIVDSLPAGTQYTITGTGGAALSAVRSHASDPSVTGRLPATGTLASAALISAIGNEIFDVPFGIQFGDGTSELSIGSYGIAFNEAFGTSVITLTGKLTGYDSSGMISTTGEVSIVSTADITAQSSGRAFNHNGTGTVTISGGTVQNTGTSPNYGTPVRNNSTGAVIINGGTVQATGSQAVSNAAGSITVSGSAVITSATAINGTITLDNSGTETDVRLTITGNAVVKNTSATGNAVYNNSTGAVIISGGTVEAEGASAYAVCNYRTGKVTITDGVIKSAATGYTVYHYNQGTVEITSPPTTLNGFTRSGGTIDTGARTYGTITWLP